MNSTRERLLEAAFQHFAASGERTVSVSELTRGAGVARGTFYNNFEGDEDLFDLVARSIASTIRGNAEAAMADWTQPHERLGCILTGFIKFSHENPTAAKFIVKFAPSTRPLLDLWSGIPFEEVKNGVKSGVFQLSQDAISYYIQMLGGSAYAFILLVSEGHRPWRDVSQNLIRLSLLAGGVSQAEAQRVSRLPLAGADDARLIWRA